MFQGAAKHAFISYVSEDAETIRRLRDDLALHGVRLWSDDDIPAGSFWEQVIQQNIQEAGFLIACFSAASQARPDNWMVRELQAAARAMGTPTPEQPWLVPVLLSRMDIPAIAVGELQSLNTLNWVPLFSGWERGVREIRDAVLSRRPPVLQTLNPVYLFASDVHVALRPLTDPADPRTPRGMLASPEAYGRFYAQGQPMEGTHFHLRPLRPREIEGNHFWKRVRALNAPELDGPWHLQLPLVCEPRQLHLELDASAGEHAAARCFVYLWPGGWSCNLEIDVPGHTPSAAVTELVSRLRSRRSAQKTGSPLRANGQPVNASGLFARLSQQMVQELGLSPGDDSLRVNSNFVLGVADAHRQAATYLRLPTATRVTLHQMLAGGRLEPQELPAVEAPREGGGGRYLLTKLRRHNFIITVFGRGSVVAASDGWGDDVKDEERMDARVLHCLAGNVRSATVQSLMLAYLVTDAREAGWVGTAPGVEALVAASRRQLRLLTSQGSRFARSFCRAHQAIAAIVGQEAGQPGAAA
jgi:hypothetical protein